MGSPPRAPDPSADNGVNPQDVKSKVQQTDEVIVLGDEHWDLSAISALAAVRMLIEVVQALSDITGDIPPTPPATRASTPKSPRSATLTPVSSAGDMPMSPLSPVSPVTTSAPPFVPVAMPSPEAHRDEPLPPDYSGSSADSDAAQHAIIARRFFVKSVPPFSISEYLLRLHKYCPHSPGVYLAAAAYIHRLCVAELVVPATSKTIHRLTLAAIRIASKALEDNKWSQDRISKVGGVSRKELRNVEISLCYLLDFGLFVTSEELQRRMFLLQQAAKQGMTTKRRLSDGFKMRLPVRQKDTRYVSCP